MTLGIVMLVHTGFDRAAEVVRYWSAAGCPVVIHVDRSVPDAQIRPFREALNDLPDVHFSDRFRCAWGTWGIVAATQAASDMLLRKFGEVERVFLTSGTCLPLRPVPDLVQYLAAHPGTDFIESVAASDASWTVGGLQEERFTLRFPFEWKRQRVLFDRYVNLQRRLRIRRRPPAGVTPHIGSQWWCLTRRTLNAILRDPKRPRFDRYFSRVWVPDESYFQTLARNHSSRIESRSLTLSKFDRQGKPYVFYDDHLHLLRASDCFVARKVWHRADALYDAFLTARPSVLSAAEPKPARIDRVFSRAVDRRTRGRAGLFMQSRFPHADYSVTQTAVPYTVLQGFGDLFEDFGPWVKKLTGATVHGHLFAPERAEFEGGDSGYVGALSDHARLRDYNPEAFLKNVLWNQRDRHQCIQFGPRDNQVINWAIAKDPNATIWAATGAWVVPLMRRAAPFSDVLQDAMRLQRIESAHLNVLRSPWVRARVHIWTMAEIVESPMGALQAIVDDIGAKSSGGPIEVPRMTDLADIGAFLQRLRNGGMHPYLMGEFPVLPEREAPKAVPVVRPVVVR